MAWPTDDNKSLRICVAVSTQYRRVSVTDGQIDGTSCDKMSVRAIASRGKIVC